MVMLMSEDVESEIIRVGNVDEVIMTEKTIGSN